MAAVCELCGKRPSFGMNLSHSHRRTKRRWDPNVQRVRAMVDGVPRRVHVCTSCIRAGRVVKPPRRSRPDRLRHCSRACAGTRSQGAGPVRANAAPGSAVHVPILSGGRRPLDANSSASAPAVRDRDQQLVVLAPAERLRLGRPVGHRHARRGQHRPPRPWPGGGDRARGRRRCPSSPSRRRPGPPDPPPAGPRGAGRPARGRPGRRARRDAARGARPAGEARPRSGPTVRSRTASHRDRRRSGTPAGRPPPGFR